MTRGERFSAIFSEKKPCVTCKLWVGNYDFFSFSVALWCVLVWKLTNGMGTSLGVRKC